MSVKVVAAINAMKKSGHHAYLYKHQGKVWVEIDKVMKKHAVKVRLERNSQHA